MNKTKTPVFVQLRKDVIELDPVQDLLEQPGGKEAFMMYMIAALYGVAEGDRQGQLGALTQSDEWEPSTPRQIARRIPGTTEKQAQKAISLWIDNGLAVQHEDGTVELTLMDYLTKSQTTNARKKRSKKQGGTQFDD